MFKLFNKILIINKMYNYLKLFIWSFFYYLKDDSEIIEEIIIDNIKDRNCITLKFTQWILPQIEPLYYENDGLKYKQFFRKLECLYDDCKYHDIKYTYDSYRENFKINLQKDYEIINEVASGTLGQIYKIKDKKGNYYALKSLHPNIRKDIFYWKMIIKFITFFPIIKNIVRYCFPFDLTQFISDFDVQTDLRNEANNLMKFYEYYKDNDFIIIPKLKTFSKDIIIMSYEEGENFHETDISYYNKCKIMMLFRLFIKNNELITNFMHGDLHKGNWKYRKVNNNFVLVFYDFGFCWNIPDEVITSLQKLDDSFIEIGIGEFNIDNFSDAIYGFLLKKVEYDIIKKSILYFLKKKYDFQEPNILLKLMFHITYQNNVLLDSIILQSLILYTQILLNFQNYGVIMKKGNNISKKISNVSSIYEGYIFSETYNIFNEYREHIKNDIIGPENINTRSIDNIEEVINIDNIDYLKKLAIS